MSLGKPTTVVLEGYFYARAPTCILWRVTIYFWHGSLYIYYLFLGVIRLLSPLECAECVSREKEAMGMASSQCLVAGLLRVARTCRKVVQATPSCRTLGSGNEPYTDLDGAWNIWQWQWQWLDVWVPRGVRAIIDGIWLQCPSLWCPLRWLGPQVVPVHRPLVVPATPLSGVRDNCGGLPPLPVDLTRSTPSLLAHIGSTAQAAPSCRVLRSDNGQVCVGTAWSIWQWQHQGGCVPMGVRAITCAAWLHYPLFLAILWGDWGQRWSLFTDPWWWWIMPPSGFWDDCCGSSLLPVDHARVATLHLAPCCLSPHKRCPVSHSLSKWPLATWSLHQRHQALLMAACTQRKRFLWWSPFFLLPSPIMSTSFSYGPDLLLGALGCCVPLPSP